MQRSKADVEGGERWRVAGGEGLPGSFVHFVQVLLAVRRGGLPVFFAIVCVRFRFDGFACEPGFLVLADGDW